MKGVLLFAMLLLTNFSAFAAPIEEADIPARYKNWSITYDVNTDGSYIETQKWSTVVLKESAVEDNKRSSVTFSTSVAKGEILEAYTLKKSERRIDAPKSSYQVTTNDGYDRSSPLYSDETTITVVFPDLAVGDTTVFSYRITNREGMFPGHFSITHDFSRFMAYDDVNIKITAPKTMNLRHQSYFLTDQQPIEKDGNKILEWNHQNKNPERWTPADAGISVVGEDPSLYVSTFDNYKQIAEAYGSRATPKAVVTERVRALASQIVADRTTPESQTNALYDWVAKNISYGGNCIGIGAVVPRDLDVVLDNRLGDCKDHATLLQALLAARNIVSDQALINANELYDLPTVPVVSTINHVINYIPSMKLFLDSTASNIPFGMLPTSLAEKPVLLVSNFQQGQKTPSIAQYGHEQIMRTNIRVNSDGTATGTTHISLKGVPAIRAREVMRNLRGDQEEYTLRKVLETQGIHGTGKLQKDDPTELLDSYKFTISFELEDLVNVASTTGLAIKPIVSSFWAISDFIIDAYEPTPNKATPCIGGRSVEEYIYEFPASQTIVGFPKDYVFSSAAIDYKATYQRLENTLTVRRELLNKTSSNMCSVGFTEEHRKSARTIMRDIRSQVLISN
jgi:transglutaminase-like putative cysteine protease